jgi:hypothetical protein
MMPDPAFYMECLAQSYEELKAATIDKPTARKKRGAGKKKTARNAAGKKSDAGKRAAAGNGTRHMETDSG